MSIVKWLVYSKIPFLLSFQTLPLAMLRVSAVHFKINTSVNVKSMSRCIPHTQQAHLFLCVPSLFSVPVPLWLLWFHVWVVLSWVQRKIWFLPIIGAKRQFVLWNKADLWLQITFVAFLCKPVARGLYSQWMCPSFPLHEFWLWLYISTEKWQVGTREQRLSSLALELVT